MDESQLAAAGQDPENVTSDLEWLEALRFRLEPQELWGCVEEEWMEAKAAVEHRARCEAL